MTSQANVRSTMMQIPLSINGFLERAGQLFPQSQVVSRLPDKSLVRHSFAQYYQRTRALAWSLLQLGLNKGDRVATLCWNHHAHLECYFGIPAAEGVMHTLNLRLAAEEIAWIANDACDRFLVLDDVLLPLFRQFSSQSPFEKVLLFRFSGASLEQSLTTEELASGRFVDYDALLTQNLNAAKALRYADHDENDPIAMCYTSGTTGRPKGVVYSHRSTVLHTLMASLPDFWSLGGRDSVLPVTPMFHANSWGIPYGCIMMGAKLVLPGPHLHPADLLDLMQLEPPTLALGVPTIWLSLIQLYEQAQVSDPGKWQFPKGMRSLVGGAAVPESLIRAFDRHGVWILQGWGMTASSPVCTISYPKAELATASKDELYRRAAMAGVPVPLVELRLVSQNDDETTSEANQTQAWDGQSVGEIQVRGPFVTGSYHGVANEPEKFTADGWLRTGDVATVDAHGFVRITDRTKDLIKSGGEWISSVDLENAIMGHPAVLEAAVIAVAHPKWSERPLACIVLKAGADSLDSTAGAQLHRSLDEHLLGQFARWQLPDAYITMAAIPRTGTGKFWKVKLREQFKDWQWSA